MNSLRVFVDRKTVSLVAVFALLLSLTLPIFASAAQVTTRSVTLSSSVVSAQNVTYKVEFTIPAGDTGAGAVALQFCSNSPLVGASCTFPAGLNVSGATVVSGFDSDSEPDVFGGSDNVIIATGDTEFATAGAKSFEIGGITNPSDDGPLYVRIITYDTAANAANDYEATADSGDNDGIGGTGAASSTKISDGSVALNLTNGIAVGGSVLESLTFCVSGAVAETNPNPITAGCTGTLTAPTVALGETVGTVKALSSSAVSTGDIYTQVSSNAIGGVVISLKNSRTCGGLARANTPTVCEIAPSADGISSGQPEFGLKVATDTTTDTALSATGTLQAVSGSNYDDTTFHLNWVSGNATGVSSVYGDPLLDTGTGPATQPSNKNMKITFGASISPNTPAGSYSADLGLIATGKF